MAKNYRLPMCNTIGIVIDAKNKHVWFRKNSLVKDKIISSSNDRFIKIWNCDVTGDCLTLGRCSSSVSCLFLDQLSKTPKLYSGSFNGEIKIWCLISNQCLRTVRAHHQSVKSLLLLSNKTDLLSCSINSIKIWNFSTMECLKTHYLNESIICLALLPTTNELISANTNNKIQFWDLENIKCRKSFALSNHNYLIRCIVPIVNLNELVSIIGKDIKIFDVNTGVLVRALKGHTSTVNQILLIESFCIISCSSDNTIKIWDGVKCHCLKTIVGHIGAVSCLLIRSNGLELASGSWDETIALWDLNNGKCKRVLKGHTSRVRYLVRMI